jgi:hypothetical protein
LTFIKQLGAARRDEEELEQLQATLATAHQAMETVRRYEPCICSEREILDTHLGIAEPAASVLSRLGQLLTLLLRVPDRRGGAGAASSNPGDCPPSHGDGAALRTLHLQIAARQELQPRLEPATSKKSVLPCRNLQMQGS